MNLLMCVNKLSKLSNSTNTHFSITFLETHLLHAIVDETNSAFKDDNIYDVNEVTCVVTD